MIITTTKHGRTRRDTKNLQAHLESTVDQNSMVVAIGNVPLSNADDVLRYMEVMRDASRATVSMHHITLNPSQAITREQRDEMVQRVLKAMNAEDHPWILWEHSDKSRAVDGVWDRHFHFVLGSVGPDGRAADMQDSYVRLEAVARTIEADFGHQIVHSRHTEEVIEQLVKMGRQDVADRLRASNPDETPRAAMSSDTRARAKRLGIDLPTEHEAFRNALRSGDSPAAQRAAIAHAGFTFERGKKDNIWIVKKDGVELGAADRILHEKRAVVAAMMKGIADVHPTTAKPSIEVGYTSPASVREGAVESGDHGSRDPRGCAEVASAAPAPRGRRGRGRTSGGTQEPTRDDSAVAAAVTSDPRRPSQQGRRPRRAAQAVAINRLARVGDSERLKALTADLRQAIKPAIVRVTEYLDAREAKAKAALESSREPVPGPAAIVEKRREIDEAKQDSRAAFYGSLEAEKIAQAVLSEIGDEKPSSLWARIIGRAAKWQRRHDEATAELNRIRALRNDRHAVVERLQGQLRGLERVERPAMHSERRRREQEGRQARDDLILVAAAKACLKDDPSLARKGEREVLRAAWEQLRQKQEERIRREQHHARCEPARGHEAPRGLRR